MEEKRQLQEKLYDFFQSILTNNDFDLQLIYENENGVRPNPPFLSVRFNSENALGTIPYFVPGIKHESEKFVETSIQPIERTMTIYGFGQSTEEALNTIRDMIQFDQYVDAIRKQGIVIKTIDSVIENASNYSEDMETFYSLDFIVTYNRIVKIENGYIASVDISSPGIKKPNGEMTHPIDMTIELK